MSTDQLNTLINNLINTGSFPHPVAGIHVVETYISYVLLTGPYAYKFKKPLDLGFLDYSTLEKRKHHCEEELHLNRRLASELYLDVIPITGTPESPHFGETGPVIEYAVRMVQFPESGRFINLVKNNQLKSYHIDELAEIIAQHHRRIPTTHMDTGFGSLYSIEQTVLQNFNQTRPCIDNHPDSKQVHSILDNLEKWTQHNLVIHAQDFNHRCHTGHIRECHGDMHLGNITLYNERPVIFDAIEFNDELRWIDTISEIAFLAMDLDYHGRRDLACRFINAYLEHTGDYQGLMLLRFYMTYRAMVRAKVTAIQMQQQAEQKQDISDLTRSFNHYLEVAKYHAQITLQQPLIIMHGVSGSGKSLLSGKLVEQTHGIRIRSDIERKRLNDFDALDKSGSGINRGIYSNKATEETYRRLLALAYSISETGFTAIVDATFLKQAQRRAFQMIAKSSGLPFVILSLNAPEDILRNRILARTVAGNDASESNLAVLHHQLETAESLTEEEQRYTIIVDTSMPLDTDHLVQQLTALAKAQLVSNTN